MIFYGDNINKLRKIYMKKVVTLLPLSQSTVFIHSKHYNVTKNYLYKFW